ncbi:ABC transporter substrate-binding protein [Rhodococcus sp. WMMA185]|uniref:ABC transporter substrate-binding protein n=1 Tax=Rhodococcus sp. WMMA185 TaxID=679318 RepID=UPI000878D92D|nr:ABC transporter substrate-binding protein [Rhodococcus sp. WMMA185]AOW94680.1 ABC transporter substrate-binding protein [Rhodococcus sp. WMMA185]
MPVTGQSVITRGRTARSLGALVGASALLLAGCVSNTEGGVPVAGENPEVSKVDAIAAQLPEEIASDGELVVGVNVPYAPNEFKDSDGNIVGFDIDLMDAVGDVLGVTPVFMEADFDRIIPAIQAGSYDTGASSFTDTLEREESVDFVTYFSAGVQWAQAAGGSVDPNNACGLRVGVQTNTIEDIEEVPAKSEACVAAGQPPIDIVKFDSQDSVANALTLGRIDAMSADSPVTGYAIRRSEGKIVAAGEIFDAQPYGWPVAKGSPLAEVLQQALQHLIDDGTYQTIAENWGVEQGVITTSQINGATS